MLIFIFLLLKALLIVTIQDLFIISHHNIKTNSIHSLVSYTYVLALGDSFIACKGFSSLHKLVAINVFVMICLVWFLNVFCMFVQLLI